MGADEPRPRVISGVQPSGTLHLGNYFGAIRQHVEWQSRGEGFFLIADYHALTVQHNAAQLQRNALEAAATYLACGIDPERSALYLQSEVPEVAELSWILTAITPMPWLERAVAYKEYRQNNRTCDAGVFNYPVLMAADILLFQADYVPVGRDQLPHVEIARDIARRFNSLYPEGRPLRVPEPDLGQVPFVLGIDGEKMSKRYRNDIGLFEEESALRDKVNRIVTDSRQRNEPKDPESCTVYSLYALMASPEEQAHLAELYRNGKIDYSEAKKMLFEKLQDYFREIRARYAEIKEDRDRVRSALEAGAEKARTVARQTMQDVRRACGLGWADLPT